MDEDRDANGQLVLLAEDEPQIADLLRAYLDREGYRTAHARDGAEAVDMFRRLRPDLMLLDIRMPGRDGLDVLQEIRRDAQTPVVMVTALAEDVDKLVGFRIGADDYVTKPFNPAEIVARVRAVLRRANGGAQPKVLRQGAIEIHFDAMSVTAAGMELALTPAEFRFLAHFARQPRRVFTRQELMDACLPDSDAFDRTVDSHVYALRRKLEAAGLADPITSVRGVGYKFNA